MIPYKDPHLRDFPGGPVVTTLSFQCMKVKEESEKIGLIAKEKKKDIHIKMQSSKE